MKQHCALVITLLMIFGVPLAHADIIEQSGDWLAQIETVKAGLPAKDSEQFVKPTLVEQTQWRALIRAMIAGDYTQADNIVSAQFPFYTLIKFSDTLNQNTIYYLLQEKSPVTKGWGTYAFNANYERPLVIQVPHPIHDTNTYSQGADVWRKTGARFFMMAGTHRCANAEASGCDGTFRSCGGSVYSVSDVAHSVITPFHLTHEEIVLANKQTYQIQLHGNSSLNCEDAFLSNGSKTVVTARLLSLKQSLQGQGGLSVAVANDGSACIYVASTNVQGRYTNGSGDACTVAASGDQITEYFIHNEQRRILRDDAAEYGKLVTAINSTIPSRHQTTSSSVSSGGEKKSGSLGLLSLILLLLCRIKKARIKRAFYNV